MSLDWKAVVIRANRNLIEASANTQDLYDEKAKYQLGKAVENPDWNTFTKEEIIDEDILFEFPPGVFLPRITIKYSLKGEKSNVP